MSQRVHLDANVILRFLCNDEPRHSAAAGRLFQKSVDGKVHLLISAVTISEVFFALVSFYKFSPADAAGKVLPFVRAGAAEFEQMDCLIDALRRVIEENVDFGDAYLAACAVSQNNWVASFDRDLKKFKDVKHYNLEGD